MRDDDGYDRHFGRQIQSLSHPVVAEPIGVELCRRAQAGLRAIVRRLDAEPPPLKFAGRKRDYGDSLPARVAMYCESAPPDLDVLWARTGLDIIFGATRSRGGGSSIDSASSSRAGS